MSFPAIESGAWTPTRTGFSASMSRWETRGNASPLTLSPLRVLGGETHASQDADNRGGDPDVVVGLDIAAELRIQAREGQDSNRPDRQRLPSWRGQRVAHHLPDQTHRPKEEEGEQQASDQPLLAEDLQKDIVRKVPVILLVPHHPPAARTDAKQRVVFKGLPGRAP